MATPAAVLPTVPLTSDGKEGWQPAATCAIDFGTSCSGFAYSFPKPPTAPADWKPLIRVNTWPGVANVKIPTSVLLDADGQFEAFGIDARSNFYQNINTYAYDGHMLFERFKMLLFRKGGAAGETFATAYTGQSRPVLSLIAQSLWFLSNEALKAINDSQGANFRKTDIQWVVTIPAIWNDSAKNLMRQAALQAELISSVSSDHLILVYEPEGAAVACCLEEQLQLPVGSKFMVLDCGGGTVDITAHEVIGDMAFRSLIEPAGGDWGSTAVDDNYMTFLSNLVGRDIFNQLEPGDRYAIVQDWENQKLRMRPGSRCTVQLASLITLCGDAEFSAALQRYNAAHPDQPIQRLNQRSLSITLPAALCASFFEGLFQQIVQCTANILQLGELANLNFIFMVGGFSSSPMLVDYLKAHIPTAARWVVPNMPWLSVVKGAAYLGVRPEVFLTRRSPRFYGVCIDELVTPNNPHPGRRTTVTGGRTYACDVFFVMVAKGQECRRDEFIEQTFYPLHQDSDHVMLRLYSHPGPHKERYIENCQPVVDLRCPTPDVHLPTVQRPIRVRIGFSDTELRFSAVNRQGQTVEVTAQYQ